MTNKISSGLKKILVLTLSIITIFIMFSQISFADNGSGNGTQQPESRDESIAGQLKNAGEKAGYPNNTTDVSIIKNIANIIKYILSFVGIIFLILIIISGFQWMMAGGNEEIIAKSKNRIKNAVIGMAITLLSYSISYFIFSILQ